MKKPTSSTHPVALKALVGGSTNILEVPPVRERIIFLHPQQPRKTAEQLRAALSSVPDDDPRLAAVSQLIDEEIGVAMLEVSGPEIDPYRRTHAAGRIDALSTLKYRLLELRR